MAKQKTSYARHANFLLFRRTRVRRDDRQFAVTKQMEGFCDAIMFKGVAIDGHKILLIQKA